MKLFLAWVSRPLKIFPSISSSTNSFIFSYYRQWKLFYEHLLRKTFLLSPFFIAGSHVCWCYKFIHYAYLPLSFILTSSVCVHVGEESRHINVISLFFSERCWETFHGSYTHTRRIFCENFSRLMIFLYYMILLIYKSKL